ncbi:hypothetical protein BKA70DRAFT_1390075 [Coprinopsis sp. MPI-PUGE-AT-0042]|nr:hypothetical protein BKA70DRAFT_1390075 [Coprinopsis sp. MPI-PUGE-AT-0042]
MSSTLSSLLLGKSKDLDNELDSLFKSAPKPIAIPSNKPVVSNAPPGKDTRTRKRKTDDAERPPSAKRAKAASSAEGNASRGKKAALQEDEDKDAAQVEEQYLASSVKGKSKAAVARGSEDEEKDGEDDTLVHESLRSEKGKKSSGKAKQKVVPEDETPEQRDKRTIFVGNLPLSVAQKRPLQKQLQRHILSLVPTAKIESVRFRSVPFQAPTAKLPEDEGSEKPKKPQPEQFKPRKHDLERTSAWRAQGGGDKDEEEVKKDDKTYLTSNQKKKIAFINQDFHNTADAVNAYIVFSHPPDTSTRAANLPPLPPTLDPYEAAKLARLIRVDRVGKIGAKGASQSTEDDDAQGDARPLQDADPKLSIFVGNLDFESKEEDLRVFFEALLEAEKGKPPGESEKVMVDRSVIDKPRTWVTHVRIVRDKDTQLGKGFAYVQFIDKDCVDEVLAMEPVKVKFAKRKLRVQRCKSVPGTSLKIKTAPPPSKKDASSSSQPRLPRPAPVEVPKGDPRLGEKLAGLSKEVRKEVKSKDADRVARRLAKKKARMAIGSKPAGAPQGRDRDRSRKVGAGKSSINPGKKMGKPRVRSEKSMAKRNGKKT